MKERFPTRGDKELALKLLNIMTKTVEEKGVELNFDTLVHYAEIAGVAITTMKKPTHEDKLDIAYKIVEYLTLKNFKKWSGDFGHFIEYTTSETEIVGYSKKDIQEFIKNLVTENTNESFN